MDNQVLQDVYQGYADYKEKEETEGIFTYKVIYGTLKENGLSGYSIFVSKNGEVKNCLSSKNSFEPLKGLPLMPAYALSLASVFHSKQVDLAGKKYLGHLTSVANRLSLKAEKTVA